MNKLLLPALVALFALPCRADELVLDWQYEEQDVVGWRLAWNGPLGWQKPDWLAGWQWRQEVAALHWVNVADSDEELWGLVWTPLLNRRLYGGERLQLWLELGIGLTLIDRTELRFRDLSSHYQFEDRLGLRLAFGERHALALRLYHYSNCNFETPNDGMDMLALGYHYRF
ncbi:acyloxyacyl hydrolase [Gallaecimonas sp. GXIMD4217]|uniref:acyloxyacyl hydrolase n=1 Tax=Gallaecimonas sp. GXIMD4217 TaxID=3131927 RepID=UPI00311AD62B